MRLNKFPSLYLFIFFVIFSFISVGDVFAQSSNSILIDVNPPSPQPLEKVNITLNSYAHNLESASITWFKNGKNISSGIGRKEISLETPESGAELVITASISLPEGNIEVRTTIKPSALTLLWQASDSYAPPFYRGKALPALGSDIKIVAMPEIKVGPSFMNPKSMTYTWKKDYENQGEDSGYSKNSFYFTNDYLENQNTVSVVVNSLDQKYSAEGNVSIVASEPKILFYKNTPGIGTNWDQALSDSYRINGPIVLVAIPYFLSPKTLEHPYLLWNWSINNQTVATEGFKKNFMPIAPQNGSTGTAELRLRIDNQDKIFQTAERKIDVEF